MSFESGTISVRWFYLPEGMPDEAQARFAKNAAPPLKTLGTDTLQGWVGGRHLLDLPITDENAQYGGRLRLMLLKAERKVPSSLYKAECMMEEFALMKALHKPFLRRAEKVDLRRQVMERLLPTMPPTLHGIGFVHAPGTPFVCTTAVSEKQAEAFRLHLVRTLGREAYALTADTAAALTKRVNVRQWNRSSFSPEVPDSEAGESAGQDFLTWVWFHAEARGGIVKDAKLGEFAATVDGPLLFAREGEGAHEIVLRKGAPLASAEAKSSLLAGKKLRRSKLILARGDQMWSCGFEADAFTFRGLRLPEDDEPAADAISRFQSRMMKLDDFRELVLALFSRFVEERNDARRWGTTVEEIRAWVAGRKSRR